MHQILVPQVLQFKLPKIIKSLIQDALKEMMMMLEMMKIKKLLIQNHFQRKSQLQLKKMEMKTQLKKTKIKRRVKPQRRRKKRSKKSLMRINKPNCRHNLMILTLKPKRHSKATLIIQKISNSTWWKITKVENLKTLSLKNRSNKHLKLCKKLVL